MEKFDLKTLEKIIKPVKVAGRRYFRSVKSFSIDSRTVKAGQAFIALPGTLCDGHDFIPQALARRVKVVVCQEKGVVKGVEACFFIVNDSKQALAAICRALRKNISAPVIAVTGSVGKTTTKEMLSFLLGHKGKVHKNSGTENNFFGVSRTLLQFPEKADYLVAELGSNAVGEIKQLASLVRPDIGIITGVKEAHLEGLSGLSAVRQEKISLLSLSSKTIGIVNRDDCRLRTLKVKNRLIWFGMTRKADIHAKLIENSPLRCRFLVNGQHTLTLQTPAYFFVYNALAALAAAFQLGLDLSDSCRVMEGFSAYPPMRMQMIVKGKIFFLNDAYNANPYSLKTALQCLSLFDRPKIAVIGDMLELGRRSAYFHSRAAGHCLDQGFAYILTYGEESKVLHRTLQKRKYKKSFHFESKTDLAAFIKKAVARDKKVPGPWAWNRYWIIFDLFPVKPGMIYVSPGSI